MDGAATKKTMKKPGSATTNANTLAALGGHLTAIGLLLLFGSFLMRLWNRIMPRFFGLPRVDLMKVLRLQYLYTLLNRLWNGRRAGGSGRRENDRLRRPAPVTPIVPHYFFKPSAWRPETSQLAGGGAFLPGLN